MKNPWDIVSGFKHDNRLKCHRGIVSQWTFLVGLNVTVDETWVDVTSRHRENLHFTRIRFSGDFPYNNNYKKVNVMYRRNVKWTSVRQTALQL
jgi:hypothetical protein